MPKTKKAKLALNLLETIAGQQLVRERLTEINKELLKIARRERELEAERKALAALASNEAETRESKIGKTRSRAVGSQRVIKALKALTERLEQAPTKSEIAHHLSVSPDRLKKPLDELMAEETVTKEGKARGTRYSLV